MHVSITLPLIILEAGVDYATHRHGQPEAMHLPGSPTSILNRPFSPVGEVIFRDATLVSAGLLARRLSAMPLSQNFGFLVV